MQFIAMDTDTANAFRNGGLDANGNRPERSISDGGGIPCRHCLRDVDSGKPMPLLAWQPFTSTHPYAETGPVFLCADPCERYEGWNLPPMQTSPSCRTRLDL